MLLGWLNNGDPGKYSYSGSGIRFDARETFSLSNGSVIIENETIFGVDNSSSVHADNR